ncbi:MAG: UvrD-helicase domain-containing protein [Sandaracinaceae bacterium]|nr:UvrD-helicase domain-containing protein [Sandaracinaceae bacterium]
MNVVRLAKPDVLGKVPETGHVVIEASAGTGKTFTIEHLVLDLLLRTETPIDQILVVTFTEKATLELRARVRDAIERFLRADTDSTSMTENTPHWRIDAEARKRLSAARDAFDTASVSTIHGFCRTVLRDRAFASQRLFAEKQISFDDAFSDAFYAALRNEFANEPTLKRALSVWLTAGQSVATLESTLRELAKAKGDVVVDYEPEKLLRAAKACLPAIERWGPFVKSTTAKGAEDREHLDRLKTCIEQALITSDAFLVACENEIAHGDVSALVARTTQKTLPAGIREEFAELSRFLLGEKALCAKFFLPVVYRRMEARKRSEGLYDYDDMLILVRNALLGPGGAALRDTLRAQYKVALIDEFQDTDDVQWEIFKRIFFDESDGHRLFLVGDPKQAIYAFRGADIATYRRACGEILQNGGKLLRLSHNFRSSERMIDAAHRIFGNNTNFFTGNNRYDEPVSAGAGAPQLVDRDGKEVSAFLVHDFSANAPATSRATKASAARTIADEIAILLDPERGVRLRDRHGERPLRASDIFVLTFKTNESLWVGRTLRERGIPYAFFKDDGLFQTEEARDLFDLFSAIARPNDRGCVSRVLLTPFFGFSLDDVAHVPLRSSEHPAHRQLWTWRRLIEDKSYAAFFSSIFEDSGVIRRSVFENNERSLTNYQQIVEQLTLHAQRSRATIDELARLLWSYITEQQAPPGDEDDKQRLQSDRDAVQIMTVHKSKGLEAAVVFLFGGYFDRTSETFYTYHKDDKRKIWPGAAPTSIKDLHKAERAEEVERLLYVALTRAKGRFVLHYFGERDGKWNGAYMKLHTHLSLLRTEHATLFQWQQSLGLDGAVATPRLAERSLAVQAAWPPAFQLGDDSSRAACLRYAHRAPLMTSYSRIARAKANDERARIDDHATELARTETLSTPAKDDLPPGITTGLFLHELLECVDIEALRAAKSIAQFRIDERIARLITHTLARYGIDSRHRAHAERVLFEAMTREISLGDRRIAGLTSASQHLREPEFIYPIPEAAHRLLSTAGAESARFSVERGYVKGYIDLIFEHEGRSYVLDWKSDTLPSYDSASVRTHAEAHYGVQARLYAIALVRMLQIETAADYERSFGGLVYFFLRSGGGEGVYFVRPTFSELGTWERELVAREQWG